MRVFSMIAVLVSVAFVSFSNVVVEGAPVVEWTAQLPVVNAAGAARMLLLEHGCGYAVAGSCSKTGAGGSNDLIFLAKTGLNGTTTIELRVYDSFAQDITGTQEVKAMLQMDNGDIVLAGTRKFNSYHCQTPSAWIMRIDSKGEVLWTSVFGTPGMEAYSTECAIIMKNGDICIGGQKDQSAWVGCVGEDGDTKWSNTFDGEKVMAFTHIKNSSWPGITAICISNSATPETIYFDRISWDGTFVSSTFSGGAIECPEMEGISPVMQWAGVSDVLVAQMNPCNEICQVKRYGDGAVFQWENDFSISCDKENVTAVASIGDGASIIAGDKPYGDSRQMWIAGMCESGKILWLTTIPTAATACAIQAVNDQEFIVLSKGANAKANFMLTKFYDSMQWPAGVAVSSAKNNSVTLNSAATDVFDIRGRLVSSSRAGRFSRGVYFSRLSSAGTVRALQFEGMRK